MGIDRLPTLVASSSSSSSSDEGADEDVAEKTVDVGVATDASRTMSACSTVHTSQRTVSRGSCKILGRRSSYNRSHIVSKNWLISFSLTQIRSDDVAH